MARGETLYESLGGGRVRCTACARYCELACGQDGLCGVRGNDGGRLGLRAYGRVIAGHVDPIEKKPAVHYRPGSRVYSIATAGCNWLCSYCQNHDISQRRRVEGAEMSPRDVADAAVAAGADGIAYTYNEPTIFVEFARDCGLEAHRRGLYNAFVSNGYATPEAVGVMAEFLDCITVDFKGNAEPQFMRRHIGVPDPAPIFETLLRIRDTTRIHIEITDLVVPGIGDDPAHCRRLCEFVHDELGRDTPVHFLAFHPDYRMLDVPRTPASTLEAHHAIARDVGLRHAYVGHVPGHALESTYCPSCGEAVVERDGFAVTAWRLGEGNRCACGEAIPIVGAPPAGRRRPLRVLP